MAHDLSPYERRGKIKQWKSDQLHQLPDAMPLSPDQLHRLLDYLDQHLKACDRTAKLTRIFLEVEKLDVDRTLTWLEEQGGYCDCEVLANLDDLDQELQRPPTTDCFVPQPKKKNSPRNLKNAIGWDLSKLPSPWRVGNMYAIEEPIQLQIGKKGGCLLCLIDLPLPVGDSKTDDYWIELWHRQVEATRGSRLPLRGPIRVHRMNMNIPSHLQSVFVESPNWTPVFGWIFPINGMWHVRFETETGRLAGDLSQIENLIAMLNGQ